MSTIAKSLFKALEGKWSIFRTIPNVGKLTGNALFVPSTSPGGDGDGGGNELMYSESGLFEFYDNSSSFTATRKFIYRLVDQDSDISVYFNDDGQEVRLFHSFNLSQGTSGIVDSKLLLNDVHLCVKDTYKVKYEFKFENENKMNEFVIEYDVKGPAKDYISHTVFKRLEKD